MPRVRVGFATRLLCALLGVVGLVLGAALLVVQRETAAQVDRAVHHAAERTRVAFAELEALRRDQLTRLSSAFTDSRRTVAALEAARESGDLGWLAETVRYELALQRIPASLVVFTDASGVPLLTMRDGRSLGAGDPGHVASLAAPLLETGAGEAFSYRVLDGRLYTVYARPLLLGDAPIGVVALGLPLDRATARRLGQVVGAEVCFVAAGRCVAGTPAPRSPLLRLMTGLGARARAHTARVDGRRWALLADPLSAERPGAGSRVLAVPLDEALAPFDRIRGALALAGLGALAVAVLVGALLARGLTRPVRALVRATGRIAQGDYAARVEVRSRDELGELAGSFNAMAEGLSLKERYRGLLDKVVSREVAEEMLRGEIQLGGETREVTTLFADIVSFTALTDGMEPPRVIALVNECLGRLGTVVEAHGGLVDKYTGDGLMAVFGAPVARPDSAAHAVRAAVEMQAAMRELNRERPLRGEPPVHVAVGVHTGPVVAGNMGSPERLNYTVLGDSVNLAARLCAEAGADEVLVSEATRARMGDDLPHSLLGERAIRGFSRPVRVYSVAPATAAPTPSLGALPLLAALLVAGLLSAAAPLGAQQGAGGQPTLVSVVSPSGLFQLDVSGRLDVEAYAPGDDPTWIVPATEPFLAGRLRLFSDVFVGQRVYGLAELRVDRGEPPRDGPLQARLEQALVRVQPWAGRRLFLQVGKFPHPFGGYAQRDHTAQDPLVRPPIMYDYRTVMARGATPASVDGFLGWKRDPARRPVGAPVIWGVSYPWGALALASAGRLDLRAAVVGSVASGEPGSWELDGDRLRRPALVGGLGLRATPELRLAASYQRGPFLDGVAESALPPGTRIGDFTQETWGAEVAFLRGLTMLRGELFVDRWRWPHLDVTPVDVSFYLEGKLKLVPGAFATARAGEIRFSRLRGETVGREEWDYPVRRLQLGAGYRLLRNVELRAEYLLARTSGPVDPHDDLLSLQGWWTF
jgi:class 3 adenylate cyclase